MQRDMQKQSRNEKVKWPPKKKTNNQETSRK